MKKYINRFRDFLRGSIIPMREYSGTSPKMNQSVKMKNNMYVYSVLLQQLPSKE